MLIGCALFLVMPIAHAQGQGGPNSGTRPGQERDGERDGEQGMGRPRAPGQTQGRAPAAPAGQTQALADPRENPIVKTSKETPTAAAQILPPAPAEAPRMTLLEKGQALERITEKIKTGTGTVVRGMGQTPGTQIDIRARDKTIEEILDTIVAGQQGWIWAKREDGSYEIWDEASFTDVVLRNRVIQVVIPILYVNAQDLVPAIDGVKSEVGQIAVNPRTNELIVTDLPDKVALVRSIIRVLDVQLYTQVFYVRHAPFEEIQDRISALKSDPGEIQIDPINRRIIVTDTFQKLKQMEQLLELLDIDRPMRIYHLNSIGLESSDATALIEDFITPITTADAQVIYNESQATLLVKDLPDVHEQILQILEAIDRTPRQVWIEAEVLEVREDYQLGFSVNASYSGDLTGATAAGLTNPFGISDLTSLDTGTIFPIVTSSAATGEGLNLRILRGDLQAELKAMQSDKDTRQLLQPRLLVRNLEEALIELTIQNPQTTTFFNNNNNTGGGGFTSTSVTFIPSGLTLTLTPTISNRGLIEMDIDFVNSIAETLNIQTGNGNSQDAVRLDETHVQTVMIIPSGETRVLGGAVTRNESEEKRGLPFLSQIPLIGGIFGAQDTSSSKRNLFFFITPTIVQESPQVDTLYEPINDAAWALEHGVAIGRPGAVPPEENPIPASLLPWLAEENPASIDGLDPEDGTQDLRSTLGEPAGELPSGEPILPSGEAEIETLQGFLHDEPIEKINPAADGDYVGPGVERLTGGTTGEAGPSGTIRSSTNASATPTPKPTPKPAAPTQPPGAGASGNPDDAPPKGAPPPGVGAPPPGPSQTETRVR